jgi:cytochrome c oxidase subunit 2
MIKLNMIQRFESVSTDFTAPRKLRPLPLFCRLAALLILITQVHANSTYQSLCAGCHGQLGEGNPSLSAPALASLDAHYLERQLHHFKSGVRGSHEDDSQGQQMTTFAKALSAEQISAIARYLSQLSPVQPVMTIKGNEHQGKKIFSSNCAACHGGDGQGNPALNAPSLVVQHDEYLLRQLKHFKQGIRGQHSDDKYGRQMAMMAVMLKDEQAMKDVIAYLNLLPTP